MAQYITDKFLEEQKIDILSFIWLGEDKDGNMQCRWPPMDGSKAVQAVKKHKEPQEDWPWFRCEVQQDGAAGMTFMHLTKLPYMLFFFI